MYFADVFTWTWQWRDWASWLGWWVCRCQAKLALASQSLDTYLPCVDIAMCRGHLRHTCKHHKPSCWQFLSHLYSWCLQQHIATTASIDFRPTIHYILETVQYRNIHSVPKMLLIGLTIILIYINWFRYFLAEMLLKSRHSTNKLFSRDI